MGGATRQLALLVADGDASFATDVATGFDAADAPVTATVVDSGEAAVRRVRGDTERVDGVIVGDELTSPVEVIDRLTDASAVPVVLLTADIDTDATIAAAVEAGAIDYFPRTASVAQCRRLAETVAARHGHPFACGTEAVGDGSAGGTTEMTYRDVFENVTDGLVVHSLETGEILDVNERFCEMHGYDRAELIGKQLDRITAPEVEYSYQAADQFIADARDGETQLFEWRNQRRDGETFPVEVHLATVHIAGQERVLASVRDISERRQLERAYQDIFENVSDGLVVHDPATGEIVEANSRACELYGRSREELLGATVDEVTGPSEEYSLTRANDLIRRAREEGPQLFEWQGQRGHGPDGEPFPMEVHLDVVEVDGEERVLASLRDITERKRRAREFEQIFNSVTDAISVIDPDTGDHLKVNRSMCELTGYDRKELLEIGISELGVNEDGDTADRAQTLIDRVMESEESETIEWKIETADGDHRLLEVNATPATIGGEERFVAIDRDITERRRAQQRLRAILDRIDEAIYITRVTGLLDPSPEPDYFSAGHEDIWGLSVEEIRETYENGFYDTLHPEDQDDYPPFLYSLVEDVESDTAADRYSREYRIERADGEIRHVRSDFYPIGWPMGPPRVVVVSRDITARKRRQQTLGTFHEATRKLTEADSREAACQQAVRAAEEVLGFPLVSVHLYDEERGELTPAAATKRLEELGVSLPTFQPGDSLPWQVYVEEESATSSTLADPVYGAGVSNPEVILSLGSHGVMLAGAPATSFDAEDIELVQILAATLEAGLNHVAGERALEERERALQKSQNRAQRLERLNTIIRDIEQATVEQSTRAGIEDAVCDRLVDVDDYDLVWLAEPALGDDMLRVRTSAGGKAEYADALSGGLLFETDEHPALEAYEAREVRAIENIATDVSSGNWRRTALRYGVQSVITVPIKYETTTHGVLTIASETPGSFDGPTQDVLAELGRSIGYAISVTERERALESEGTTELEFAVADDGLFMVRAARTAGCRVALERTVRRAGGAFSTFYAIEGADPAEVAEFAEAAASIERAQVVSRAEGGEEGLIEVTGPGWFGSVFTDHGAVVQNASATDGDGTLVVEAPRGADIRTLVESFQERYPETELVAQRQRDRTVSSLFELQDALRAGLTDRQWEALETAYSAGYFEWPRETTGNEVADLLDISQPTFNKHLRVAEQVAFGMLLEREYPGKPA